MRTWVLIADASRARIFATTYKFEKLVLVHQLEHKKSRLRDSELISDKGGRTRKNHTIRSSMDFQTSPHDMEEKKFAVQIADFINVQNGKKAFRWLIAAAPARFLSYLRDEFEKTVAEKIVCSLEKDYTRTHPDNLKPILRAQVPTPFSAGEA